MSTVIVQTTEVEQGGELRLSAESLAELGLQVGVKLVLEVKDGVIVARRATITELTRGAGAPWRKVPPPTREEEKDAFERAVAEDNARYE